MPIVDRWGGGEVDVAIVGAGAAGIAAARHLMAFSRLSVLVLEASRRVGGRAHTVTGHGAPIDLGCAWLHAGRTNEWTRVAADLAFEVDRTPAPWNREEMLQFGPEEQRSYAAATDAFYDRVAAQRASAQDCAMGALIDPSDRWRPFLDAVSTFVSGAELDRVSCHDHEEYRPGEGPDWRVVDGYGHLVATYATDAPIVLDTAVTEIDHRDRRAITIETGRGRLSARCVVVTVSTEVLAAEVIRFLPGVPATVSAAARLPLGVANKIFLALDPVDTIGPETYRLGSSSTAATGAYHIRPFGRPVIECFYGGRLARDLEAGGPAAFEDFAVGELASLFGDGIRRKLSPIRSTAWAGEPFIRGSYSYAVPGAAGDRAILARPVDGRLFFAGEAASLHKNTTAHGAFETGVAAADAILAAMTPARSAKTTAL